ncbi:MAG: integration host factor subunit beta [Elusimicrobia bacterium]|nr:integration host factor subunit beta [Elusimicrobiota bacterium]
MNRYDIIREISRYFSRERDAKTAVCKTFEIISSALRRNEKIVISNFGTFRISQRNSRQARNPKTNQKVMVGPRKSVRFKASDKLLTNLQ